MGFSLEFLGTGDSAQVPVYNCNCVACLRARSDTRLRRGPSSAMVRIAGQQWLIDAGRMDLADVFPAPAITGILDFSHTWQPFESRQIAHVKVTAVPLQHSKPCLGYVFESAKGRCAYLTDTVDLSPETYEWLRQRPLTYCIVDCSHPPQEQAPRNHNDVTRALEMCEGLEIEQLYFTHLSHEMDRWLLQHQASLPSHVHIARDGLYLFC